MPTIKELSNGFRFFLHVHVSKDNKVCKFWMEPVSLAKNYGFSSKKLNTIYKQIQLTKNLTTHCWYEHCDQ